VESQLDLFEATAEGDRAWSQLPEEARKEAIELLARLVLACGALLAGEVRDER
jgi:hypothetical protein